MRDRLHTGTRGNCFELNPQKELTVKLQRRFDLGPF